MIFARMQKIGRQGHVMKMYVNAAIVFYSYTVNLLSNSQNFMIEPI